MMEMRSPNTVGSFNQEQMENDKPSRDVHDCAPWQVFYGRPDVHQIIFDMIRNADATKSGDGYGGTPRLGIGVCGPPELTAKVKSAAFALTNGCGCGDGRVMYCDVHSETFEF